MLLCTGVRGLVRGLVRGIVGTGSPEQTPDVVVEAVFLLLETGAIAPQSGLTGSEKKHPRPRRPGVVHDFGQMIASQPTMKTGNTTGVAAASRSSKLRPRPDQSPPGRNQQILTFSVERQCSQ